MSRKNSSCINSAAAFKSGEEISFSFGKNWLKFVNQLSEPQITGPSSHLWNLPACRKLENPVQIVREYSQSRGMAYFRDVEDWFGALPYQNTSAEKVTKYLRSKGFELVRRKKARSHGCNEFLFMRLAGA